MLRLLVIGAGAVLLASGPALACSAISSQTIKLTACVDEQWQSQKGEGAVEFNYLTADGNFGLQVITETAVLPGQTMHDAILANAASAAGGDKSKVKTIAERVENIDGKPFNVLDYTIEGGNIVLEYQNYYYSQPGLGTVQILGLSVPADGNAAAFKVGEFAATVKLGS